MYPYRQNPIWNNNFYSSFKGFESLRLFDTWISKLTQWPSIEDYQTLAHSMDSFHFEFILQNQMTHYESSIYQAHQIPTRLNNWHDFFNNLTWAMWPKAKFALLKKNYTLRAQNGNQRVNLQNVLAHIDECGLILCTTHPELFSSINQHQWQNFFTYSDLTKKVMPYIFGHGLFEKGLMPYIGMTAKLLLFEVKPDFFTLSQSAQISYLDSQLSLSFENNFLPEKARELLPFPLLGWPGWWPIQDVRFYQNGDYFRPLNKSLSVLRIWSC